MIVTISGKGWSGKSTCAKKLAHELWFERLYAGQVFRDNAKNLGLDLQTYLTSLEKTPDSEKEIDIQLKKTAVEMWDVVFETRVGKYLFPDEISIFLDVSIQEWTSRIMKDLVTNTKRNEVWYDTYPEALVAYEKRIDEDRERYKKLYGMNIYDQNMYDIVIDTTSIPADEVVQILLEKIKNF